MKIISMKGLVEKAHGKICQDDNNSVSYRKKDGAMFSMRRCNNRNLETNPYTDREKEIQSTFTKNSQIAAAWTAKNRVFKDDGHTIDYANCTEDYKKMRTAFDAQDKIVSFQPFVWSCIEDGAVVVPDVAASSTGGSSDSGSSSNSGSSTTKYTLNLAASPTNGGTVSGAGSYAAGTSVEVTATPASGYTFSQWSDGNTSASRNVTVNADQTLTAVFVASGSESEGGDGHTDSDGQMS